MLDPRESDRPGSAREVRGRYPGDVPAEMPLPLDPWAHRKDGMRCRTCMWWARKQDSHLGRCRRHAPTMSGYPAVFEHDWCGDHKLDESRI